MEKIRKFCDNSIVRYVFFGGCTTAVNLVSFYCMRKVGVELNTANIISIVLAVLFAYVVNAKYVFLQKCERLRDHLKPFCKFVGARLATMLIEVGGLWAMVELLHVREMTSKFVIMFIVLVLNYVFSKLFVFAKE